MRRLRFAAGVLLALALASCSDPVSPVSERSKLDANRQAWVLHGYHSYSFTLTEDCFCGAPPTATVVVRNDSVISWSAPSANEFQLSHYKPPTILELFAVIEQSVALESLHTTYNPDLGFPSEIRIGDLSGDGGVIYFVSNVKPIMLPP